MALILVVWHVLIITWLASDITFFHAPRCMQKILISSQYLGNIMMKFHSNFERHWNSLSYHPSLVKFIAFCYMDRLDYDKIKIVRRARMSTRQGRMVLLVCTIASFNMILPDVLRQMEIEQRCERGLELALISISRIINCGLIGISIGMQMSSMHIGNSHSVWISHRIYLFFFRPLSKNWYEMLIKRTKCGISFPHPPISHLRLIFKNFIIIRFAFGRISTFLLFFEHLFFGCWWSGLW